MKIVKYVQKISFYQNILTIVNDYDRIKLR